VTEITKRALSLRITDLVELRLCLLICSTERKTGLQQHHVEMYKYGICMKYGRFGSIPYIKSSIPYLGHSIFHTDIFFPFHTIPYHVCPVARKFSIGGLCVSAGGLPLCGGGFDILKIDKISTNL